MKKTIKINEVDIYEGLNSHNKRRALKIETRIIKRLKVSKINYFEIGKDLSEAKKLFGRQYQKWVEQTFGHEFSYQMALNYRAVYEFFKDRPKIIESVPITLLLDMAREMTKDAVFEEIDKALESGHFDELKKKVEKCRQESILKDYVRLKRGILEGFKYMGKIYSSFAYLPQQIERLYSSNYNELEILGYLKKIDEEGHIVNIDNVMQRLNAIKQAYYSARKHYEESLRKEDISTQSAA